VPERAGRLDGQHMPVGMQLVGKCSNEPLLFRAGVAIRRAPSSTNAAETRRLVAAARGAFR